MGYALGKENILMGQGLFSREKLLGQGLYLRKNCVKDFFKPIQNEGQRHFLAKNDGAEIFLTENESVQIFFGQSGRRIMTSYKSD